MTAEYRAGQPPFRPPPIVGYVEGFIATTRDTVEGRPPFTRESLEELRDHVLEHPWLYPPQQDREELLGRVVWSEVVPVGPGFDLWARVEFYSRENLQLSSAGVLGLLGFPLGSQTTPA